MEEKLVSTVHTFVGKRSNTLRSWWRRGRDDHLDAAGWLPAGYRPLWSSRRNLPRPPWYVAGSRVPSATGKDGDGKPPPLDDQNYGGSAGVVAAMSRRGLVWTAGGAAR